MSKFLDILMIIGRYRAVLFPAVIGFISAVASAMGWHLDVGKMQAVINATGLLATALATVVGAVMDANNANVKAALGENKQAIESTNTTANVAAVNATVATYKLAEVTAAVTENARQLDQVTPPGMSAVKVDPPVVIAPAQVVIPPKDAL